MSDHTPPAVPSDTETADFRSLGLTPGNWPALAPVPLLLPGARPAGPGDFDLFRRLAALVPGLGDRAEESGEFWSRYAQFRPPASALALLGWHLAKRLPRADREAYLRALARAAGQFFPDGMMRPDVVKPVREAVETALGHAEYRTHLTPRVAPSGAEDDGWPGGPVISVLAARLSTLPFAERYELLEGPGRQVAPEWVDELREQVERILSSGGELMTGPPPEHVPPAGAAEPAAESTAVPTDPQPQPPTESAPALPPEPPPTVPEVVTPLRPPAAARAELAGEFAPLRLREALARARGTTVAKVRDWWDEQGHAGTLLFDGGRDECREVAVVRDERSVPEHLWVIGDVHADVLALANLVAFARRESGGKPAFVFLGDFVDRGPFDHETLLFLFGLVMEDEGSVCVIPGNHDTDLRWSEKAGKFVVTIQPAEYCDRLNALLGSEREEDREQVELAKLAIEFFKTRPKAVFLPDGTMLAHGGFPHTDLQKVEADPRRGRAEQVLLREVKQLGEPNAVSDFLWARLSESPKKRPNRHGNRGHEFGWRDFAQFCKIMTEEAGVPVRRLVRGHDHVAARWQLPPDYAEHGFPVLTLNAMGWRMDGEPPPPDGPHPLPVIARHVPDNVPLVFRVPLDPAEVDRAFAREEPAAPEPPVADAADFLPPPIEVESHAPPPPTRRMTDAELEGGG